MVRTMAKAFLATLLWSKQDEELSIMKRAVERKFKNQISLMVFLTFCELEQSRGALEREIGAPPLSRDHLVSLVLFCGTIVQWYITTHEYY